MEKKTSCGVILTDGVKLLAIRPYGKVNMYDLPKGRQEIGEEKDVTASRELFEETGIRIAPEQLKFIGDFYYLLDKDLSLFLHKTDKLPPIESMKCTSFFKNEYGRQVPEAVGYAYVTFDNPSFYRNLQPILQKIGKTI